MPTLDLDSCIPPTCWCEGGQAQPLSLSGPHSFGEVGAGRAEGCMRVHTYPHPSAQ